MMNIFEKQSIGRGIRQAKSIALNSVYGAIGGERIEYATLIMYLSSKSVIRKKKLEELFPEFKDDSQQKKINELFL
jgi:hypothetical protein